jgi:hypothetical protein
MNVEFAEWQVIPQMLFSGFLADKVKQLAVEIHFKEDDPLETCQCHIRVLQQLESTSSVSNKKKRKICPFQFTTESGAQASHIDPGQPRGIHQTGIGVVQFEILRNY